MNSLQAALLRIEEIQQRFEAAPKPAVNAQPVNQEGQTFQSLLNQETEALPPSASRREVLDLIQDHASEQEIDPNLVKAVVQAESGFNSHAVSPVGARGLMQLMPSTAKTLGVQNSFNPDENIQGGTKYLKQLLQKYDSVPNAVAAYNAGPGAVDKHKGIPPYKETQQYVKRVMNLYQQFSQSDDS